MTMRTRDPGRGTRDSGLGTRDARRGRTDFAVDRTSPALSGPRSLVPGPDVPSNPESGLPNPGSAVSDPRSLVPGPGSSPNPDSRTPDPEPCAGPGSLVPGPVPRLFPNPQSPIANPGPSLATVIVPTYNEREALPVLLAQLGALDLPLDVIVADDASPDGTGEVADDLARDAGETLRIAVLHRPRRTSLAQAVVAGARASATDVIVVMDADGSHPAAAVPALLRALNGADVAVASRYVPGSTIADWPRSRRLISRAATAVARAALDLEARDPLSGFFAAPRRWLADPALHAVGYKLLLEVLARHPDARVREVPYGFVERRLGASKLSRAEIRHYLWLVWRLRRDLSRRAAGP